MSTKQAGGDKYLITSSHFTTLKTALGLSEREDEKCKLGRLVHRELLREF